MNFSCRLPRWTNQSTLSTASSTSEIILSMFPATRSISFSATSVVTLMITRRPKMPSKMTVISNKLAEISRTYRLSRRAIDWL